MRVQCGKISLAFGDRDLLKNVSLALFSGGTSSSGLKTPSSRAALAGVNGSGKSTLMKIIAGIASPDSGDRSADKNCRVFYLPQSGQVFRGRTLREEAETAYQSIRALLLSMETLGERLERTVKDDGAARAMLEEYHGLQQAVEDSGYYRREERITQVLGGLGFSRADLDRECGEFSGGWQMRIALAKALLENPDIMLLDEPTNYLDIEARTWLEEWLRDFSGGYLLVSHDRYFLDVCVNEVYEIFQGTLKRWAGNYSAYEKTRRAELESLLKRYAEQREEIEKTEALIRRFRYKASKAAMVQERIKRLEKMERIEIPESLKKIALTFPPPPHSGRIVLTLTGVGKRYGERRVLAGLDLTVEAGEKLVVVGRNGAGKSTLLRVIASGGAGTAEADPDHEGTVSYGVGVRAGYFSQDNAEVLTGDVPVLEFLEAEAPTALVPRLRDMLGAFLFRGDDVYKSLSVLSGGEKSRLALLRLLLRPVNLLILDEPTNHLDLHSKDILLDALLQFTGAVIFVSHDRAFMEALSTKTLELRPPESGPSAARLFYGGYGYYGERLNRESGGVQGNIRADGDAAGSTSAAHPGPAPGGPAPGGGAAEVRRRTKERQALIRRLERREEEALAAIEALEREKARLEEELSKPEVYSLGEKAAAVKAALDRAAGELEAKSAEWESLAAELTGCKISGNE
ncbi:MAG: ABC-F family ATP-binding cassette domain-containing protein [Treponema sp.]|jgi:ATP-binding cassette subfamily F protein 3|nr:ABC-F family ATP-binding cassette domain-containing protein [Treponema sp.]